MPQKRQSCNASILFDGVAAAHAGTCTTPPGHRRSSLPPRNCPPAPEVPESSSSASAHDIVAHPFTTTFIQIKARQLARRSDFSRSDADDLQQDMLLHLLEVADQYDSARGNVEAFVTHVIKTWIMQLLRDKKAEKRGGLRQSTSLDHTFVDSDGSETTRAASVTDADHQRRLQDAVPCATELLETRDELAHMLSCLSAKQRDLVMHVAEHGVLNASRRFGISRRQVRKQIHAIRQIFTFFTEQDR